MAKHRSYSCGGGCPVEATLDLIGGKWKGLLLYHLLSGTHRFNQLRRILTTVTPRMLTAQLRELEQVGLVRRQVYAEVPPRVEYSLTPRGRTLAPIISALKAWGTEHALPLWAERRQRPAARARST
jgi:DNA-binding HxlR family transcriptional regulator